jgi:hypothetical protein
MKRRKDMASKLLTARLTVQEYRDLQDVAEHRGMSMTGLLRFWIKQAKTRKDNQ